MEMIRNNRITTIYVRSYYSDGINGPRYDINSKWRGLCQICSILHELKLKLITNQFRVLIVIIIRLSSRHHVCSDPCYRHSSVIKASCLFRSLLSSFVCHQASCLFRSLFCFALLWFGFVYLFVLLCFCFAMILFCFVFGFVCFCFCGLFYFFYLILFVCCLS